MNTIVFASLTLGLAAAFANAGASATNNTTFNPSTCGMEVVKAKQDTVWTNMLEGGPIKAIVHAASHARPYRNIVCANPGVDWSQYGHIEVESIIVAPTNLNKPLTQNQLQPI